MLDYLRLPKYQAQSMGMTPPDKIARWVAAVGQTGKPPAVIGRITMAGEFLEKTGRLSEHDACQCLTGIDFSHPVLVVRLPPGTYTQFAQQHRGAWFTLSGLMPTQVGLAHGNRTPRRFRPEGIVWALQSVARPIKDTWTSSHLEESLDPRSGKRGEWTIGGGTQYFVIDRWLMKPV